MLRALALAVSFLISGAVLAGEAVPVNTTFGIQWTPVDWSNPADRITESLGATGLSSGKVIGIAMRDHLDTTTGRITSDYVTLVFSDADWVYAEYKGIPAGYDPLTNTALFAGALEVLGGEGRFQGATGTLTIRSRILFSMPVGTVDIKGVIKTAN